MSEKCGTVPAGPGGVLMSPPTAGRIVHYRLSEQDAENINQRRAAAWRVRNIGATVPEGNDAAVGQVFPAMVVRTFDGLAANLQVFLDGNDTHWATSRGYSVTTEGCWFWPPRFR